MGTPFIKNSHMRCLYETKKGCDGQKICGYSWRDYTACLYFCLYVITLDRRLCESSRANIDTSLRMPQLHQGIYKMIASREHILFSLIRGMQISFSFIHPLFFNKMSFMIHKYMYNSWQTGTIICILYNCLPFCW